MIYVLLFYDKFNSIVMEELSDGEKGWLFLFSEIFIKCVSDIIYNEQFSNTFNRRVYIMKRF